MRPTGELTDSYIIVIDFHISLPLSLCLSTTALRFIEKMCICSLPLPPASVSGVPQPGQSAPPSGEAASSQQQQLSVLETWQWIIDDNLPHTEESIREAAVSALTHLCSRYYSTDPKTIKKAQGK